MFIGKVDVPEHSQKTIFKCQRDLVKRINEKDNPLVTIKMSSEMPSKFIKKKTSLKHDQLSLSLSRIAQTC